MAEININNLSPLTGNMVASDGNVYNIVDILLEGGGGGSAVIQSLNVTPTTSAQTITASGVVDGYSPVNVSAVTSSIDANITSANIVDGITILGVTGSATELNGTTLNVTPTTSAQTITPTSPNNGFTEVDVDAVTSSIDANIQAGNIKNGVTILGVTGNYSGTTPTGTLSITQNGTYDVTNYASANVSVSGGAKYKLYDRVKDDSNNEIGTVSGFYTDSNNNEYAVVCLDAQYRLAAGAWSSTAGTATNMPLYGDYSNIAIWGDGVESATTNTQLILDWCTAHGYTSTACEHCRSKYFTIDGVTYYGQLPNMSELLDIFRNHHRIEDADTSSSSAGTTLNWATEWKTILASNQVNNAKAWFINNVGSTSSFAVPGLAKATNAFICPVLEIPNT